MMVSIVDGRVEGYETLSEYAKRMDVAEVTARLWVRRNKIETLLIGRDHWVKIGTAKPEDRRRGRPTGSCCDYSKSKWHRDGYMTISEYATECEMYTQEVESAIRRKLLVVERFNGIRYIPNSMPKYRVRYLNGSHHRYTFVLQPSLKERDRA